MKNINYSAYETVIGLEVHAALKTKTKIFCSCENSFGGKPNSRVCPVCMGYPGTLPVLNRRVLDLAISAGLALNCKISDYCFHDRKNYFYPDCPKAYQISQLYSPLCRDGYIDIDERRIRIERIHIEEDAGKLLHNKSIGTLLDFNRCGAPLIEIVSMPDLRSGREARRYLEELRAVLIFAGASDCKMNEGSLRCDINISVRKKGEAALGTRTEIKNLNSFAFAEKAIEYEAKRQIELIERGEKIIRQTRRYDEKSGKTHSMRDKEESADYRYFPEPDLPPFTVSSENINYLRSILPIMPQKRTAYYSEKYKLSPQDARRIAYSEELSALFDEAATHTTHKRTLANFLICDLPMILKEEGREDMSVDPVELALLCDITADGQLNSSSAKLVLRELLLKRKETKAIVSELGLLQINDRAEIEALASKAIADNPRAVLDYKNGKSAAAKALVGYVMKLSYGRANPTIAAETVEDMLKNDRVI